MNTKALLLALSMVSITTVGLYMHNKPTDDTIRMYAFYTPSHAELVEKWFKPSIKDDYALILEFHEQECPTGSFMSPGWKQTMHRKIDLILRAIEECWGGIFVHSDIDIQFFKPTKELLVKALEDNDFVVQQDDPKGGICAGFFACRANEQTRNLWQTIKQMVDENPRKHDQDYLNELLRNNKIDGLRWSYLPSSFFGGGTLLETPELWTPGKTLPVPKDIVMHHANYTVGVENKIKQLAYVKSVVEAQQQA